jgi:hypothetical protein
MSCLLDWVYLPLDHLSQGLAQPRQAKCTRNHTLWKPGQVSPGIRDVRDDTPRTLANPPLEALTLSQLEEILSYNLYPATHFEAPFLHLPSGFLLRFWQQHRKQNWGALGWNSKRNNPPSREGGCFACLRSPGTSSKVSGKKAEFVSYREARVDLSLIIFMLSQSLNCHKTSWCGTNSHQWDLIVLITGDIFIAHIMHSAAVVMWHKRGYTALRPPLLGDCTAFPSSTLTAGAALLHLALKEKI